MIRLLSFLVTIFVIYISVISLNTLDTKVVFSLYDYVVESSIVSIAIALLILITLVLFTIKIITLIILLPSTIKNHLKTSKSTNDTNNLINALAILLVDNKKQGLMLSKKISDDIKNKYSDIYNIIQSKIQNDSDKKILYLKNLINSNQYNYFAVVEIAKTYYLNKIYTKAEEYAVIAHNINSYDITIIKLLIEIYASLESWNNFSIFVDKLRSIDQKAFQDMSYIISQHYFTASKNALDRNDNANAENYLQESIDLDITNINSLNLYYNLYKSQKDNKDILSILKKALSINPCIDIAKLCIKASNNKLTYNDLFSKYK